MLSFKQFLTEHKELPFDHHATIGWWKDKGEKDGHHVVYHGTHKKNLAAVLKHGLNHKDPHTGMISVTHDPHTAFGYASMSGSGGESNFRKAGHKPVNTPHEDRVVIKMHIPHEWAEKHMDHHMSGNTDRSKMTDSKHYHNWKSKNPHKSDHEYYTASELRMKHEIPAHFIQGYSFKKKK